jgi:rubrerythrin
MSMSTTHQDIATVEEDRAAFLKRAGLAGAFGGAALLGLMADGAQAQSRSDVAILNYALTLEYLEAAFYTEAEEMGKLDGELAEFAAVVGEHERAHVKALKQVLGARAVKRPRFDFQGTTERPSTFRATAIVLEDTGVAAYAGQAPRVKAGAVLEAALAIHSVEARHASWIRDIAGKDPAPKAFDEPLTKGQVLAAVARTGFIRPARAMRPRFTG